MLNLLSRLQAIPLFSFVLPFERVLDIDVCVWGGGGGEVLAMISQMRRSSVL